MLYNSKNSNKEVHRKSSFSGNLQTARPQPAALLYIKFSLAREFQCLRNLLCGGEAEKLSDFMVV